MDIVISTQCTDSGEIAAKVKAAIDQYVADGKAMASRFVEPECKKWYCQDNAKPLPADVLAKAIAIADGCSITGNLGSAAKQPVSEASTKSHGEAKAIMEARKAEIRGEASPLVGGIVGEVSSFISAYERPAIVITDRIGDAESTIEFATSADYKAWKELE